MTKNSKSDIDIFLVIGRVKSDFFTLHVNYVKRFKNRDHQEPYSIIGELRSNERCAIELAKIGIMEAFLGGITRHVNGERRMSNIEYH